MIRSLQAALKVALVVSIGLMASGCMSINPMAWQAGSAPPEATKAVALLTVTTRSDYAPRHQPKLTTALLVPAAPAAGASKVEIIYFAVDEIGANVTGEPEKGNSYLLRMALDPGSYTLLAMAAESEAFFIKGKFTLPLNSEFTLASPGFYYLGHIQAEVRERQGNEFRAGPLIPLMDQAVVGAAHGTFDVTISDRQGEDEALFRSAFPVLGTASITPAILPPFDREKAQKNWEAQ